MEFGFLKKTKKEELIFGLILISAVLMKYQSGVPAIAASALLAFYYLVFGWYLFPVSNETHLTFSIFSGLIYALCLIGIGIYSGKLYEGFFFYYVQLVLLLSLFSFLMLKKNWGDYRTFHYVRISVIALLNVYVFFF